jgi:hypothetical protein
MFLRLLSLCLQVPPPREHGRLLTIT